MHHMNTPHIKPIRVTVPVTPEVLALFQRLSIASGKSVGRMMGEWLDETREGLEPMIEIVESFKTAPRAAVQALQLRANALTDMAAEVVQDAMRLDPENCSKSFDPSQLGAPQVGAELARIGASVSRGKRGLTPPSSNTGGKGKKTPTKSIGG